MKRAFPGAMGMMGMMGMGMPPAKMMRGNETTGEIRFQHPMMAQQAVAMGMNGMFFNGAVIGVMLDPNSPDGTKLIVSNLPPGTRWQALKDFFANFGAVEFAAVGGDKGGGVAAYNPGGMGTSMPPAKTIQGNETMGEVRFQHSMMAQQALAMNGMIFNGASIGVMLDPNSPDGTKLIVSNLPPGTRWQALKDFFANYGTVEFAAIGGNKGGGGAGGGGSKTGEVRFEAPEWAQLAAQSLNGLELHGNRLSVQLDTNSKDGTKVLISNIPPSAGWQDLKDFCQQGGGKVAFANINGGAADAKAGGYPGNVQALLQTLLPGLAQLLGGGGGGKGDGGKGAPQKRLSTAGAAGEVRFATAACAQAAVQQLSQVPLKGTLLSLSVDPKSPDGTKVMIQNLPAGMQWQELKDHFKQCGEVSFASIFGPGEIRMGTAEEASQAAMQMNGFIIDGQQISVQLDPNSHDNTKLIVDQLPPSVQWQELKDHFKTCGTVAFAAREKV